MENLSNTAQKTLLSNLFDNESECYGNESSVDRQQEMLNKLLNDPDSIKQWIEDFRSDAESSQEDFPELAKRYFQTANELEEFLQ